MGDSSLKTTPGARLDAAGLSEAAQLEAYLLDWIDGREMPPNLRDALLYVLQAGGKRVRPRLVIASCRAVGGSAEEALPAAAALELIHNFSLVHDDLPAMDDDDLRRGRPTLHRHAGEALAILAGDMMNTLAFELIATRSPERLRGPLCAELALAAADMIGGQVYDTLPVFENGLSERQRLELVHRLKTAALIRCACRMGAMCGGAGEVELEGLSGYGEAMGLMFQVVDDWLDVTQTTEHLGKRAKKDEACGKLTYPLVHGVEGTRAEVERLTRAALAALTPLGAGAQPLRELCQELAERTR
jgi:geranylgeranyl diphosphate synthase type II